VIVNMAAKAAYAAVFGSRGFAVHLVVASLLSIAAGMAAVWAQAVV
jgi:hypothetical protein